MATTVFSVVGEHRDEPHRLLLLGDDGHFYAFATDAAQPTAVRSTEEWELDPELVEDRALDPTDDDL